MVIAAYVYKYLHSDRKGVHIKPFSKGTRSYYLIRIVGVRACMGRSYQCSYKIVLTIIPNYYTRVCV